jgi:transcriptional regulator with XRE-family HTH domain
MVFNKRLEELCRMSGKSINKIERDLGYPRNALHNYKKDAAPSGIRLVEIAQYFNVSPGYLIGKTETKNPQSVKQVFCELNSEQKLAMTELCYKWLISERK